jgi:hypothetical protein
VSYKESNAHLDNILDVWGSLHDGKASQQNSNQYIHDFTPRVYTCCNPESTVHQRNGKAAIYDELQEK